MADPTLACSLGDKMEDSEASKTLIAMFLGAVGPRGGLSGAPR